MSTSMEDVRMALDPEEPNYSEAAALGREALPYLGSSVVGSDPRLASKAAYLASMITDGQSVEVLARTGRSPEPVVRVATAAGLRNTRSAEARQILQALLGDEDGGVRRIAMQLAAHHGGDDLGFQINTIAKQDPDPSIRELAIELVDRFPLNREGAPNDNVSGEA